MPVAVVGVHNSLVCRLAAQSGFEAGWVSSLEMSAVHGLPDRNLLGLAEMVSAARSMALASDLPLIVDADNGYGTLETTARAIREFCRSEVAAACIEDSSFPKRNSFLGSGARDLEPVDEFARKITTAKEAQTDPDFLVIARTESLIAGEGLPAALERASRYADAGADLVLIHSRRSDGREAIDVARAWDRDTPLLTIPTAFPHLSLEALGRLGYRVAIYANQLLRASMWGVSEALAALRSGTGGPHLETRIASMTELLGITEDFRSSAAEP